MTEDQAGGSHAPLAISDGPANDAAEAATNDQGAGTLNVDGGEPIKLDQLGPMIINSDGTISRITNWHELTPAEQERTVRLLVKKRNVMRLKKITEADIQQTSSDADTK